MACQTKIRLRKLDKELRLAKIRQLQCCLCACVLALLCFWATSPVAVHAQSDGLAELGNEALLAPIRLAARGGDFDLAGKRLAKIEKNHLIAMGTAALAAEYERAEAHEEARRLYDAAIDFVEKERIRARERVSAYLYIAKVMNEDEDYAAEAEEMLKKATRLVGNMAGFDLDMALVELAQVGLVINRDTRQAKEILLLISDKKLRDKLLQAYRFDEKEEAN